MILQPRAGCQDDDDPLPPKHHAAEVRWNLWKKLARHPISPMRRGVVRKGRDRIAAVNGDDATIDRLEARGAGPDTE